MSTTRTLLIDADDTLWDNNIYFEYVAAQFFEQLAARNIPLPRAEQLLWQTERRNVKITGYGSKAFCQSLHQVAKELGATDLEPWITEQENWILHHPIEFLPGVRETLPVLRATNQLIVVTKGREDEQLGKLRRSGLQEFFHATEVVFEKDPETYRDVVRRHQLLPNNTWMIGNSPRSDINPAKAAGLGTVFIPYHTTWQHELEEISPNGSETLMLENFGQLADYFG
ncbi:MAG TPA: HAD family hydrolase [Verrucomicrobiae bacterium]|nr:HAD family hydrolase [Verrucomicrobiae bacterium]